MHISAIAGASYHVPEEVGHPVDGRTDAADKLQVFGLGDPLLDQIQDKAGRNEGHGKDDANGHHRIHRGGQAVRRTDECDQLKCQKISLLELSTSLSCRDKKKSWIWSNTWIGPLTGKKPLTL